MGEFSNKNCSVQADRLKVSFVKKELALIKDKIAQARSSSGNDPKVDARISDISVKLNKLIAQDKSVSDMWRRFYDYYLKKKGLNCSQAMQKTNAKFKSDSNYKRLVLNLVANADNILRTMICDVTSPLTVTSCPVIHTRRSGSTKRLSKSTLSLSSTKSSSSKSSKSSKAILKKFKKQLAKKIKKLRKKSKSTLSKLKNKIKKQLKTSKSTLSKIKKKLKKKVQKARKKSKSKLKKLKRKIKKKRKQSKLKKLLKSKKSKKSTTCVNCKKSTSSKSSKSSRPSK